VGIIIAPPQLGEREAYYLYPALSESDKAAITAEDFALLVEEMLIAAGDLADRCTATKLGISHGIFNHMGSTRELSDEGWEISKVQTCYVMPSRKGEEYIKNLVKDRFPGLDEEIYNSIRREMEESCLAQSVMYKAQSKRKKESIENMLRERMDKNKET